MGKKKLHYMPFYGNDFYQDTKELTYGEQGAYLALIWYHWVNGSVPSDQNRLRRIANVPAPHWPRVWASLSRFFVTDQVIPTRMYQSRVLTELTQAREKSNKNRGAALQMHAKRRASGVQTQLYSESDSERREEAAAPLPPGAEEGAPLGVTAVELIESCAAPPAPPLALVASTPSSKIYAFDFCLTRFTHADYAELERKFPHIELQGALMAIAATAQHKPSSEERFKFVMNSLAARNQIAKERIDELARKAVTSKPKSRHPEDYFDFEADDAERERRMKEREKS